MSFCFDMENPVSNCLFYYRFIYLLFYFTSFFFLPASTTNIVSAANIASTKGIARILSAVFTPALSACASDAVSVPVTEPAVEDWTDSDGCPDVVAVPFVSAVLLSALKQSAVPVLTVWSAVHLLSDKLPQTG